MMRGLVHDDHRLTMQASHVTPSVSSTPTQIRRHAEAAAEASPGEAECSQSQCFAWHPHTCLVRAMPVIAPQLRPMITHCHHAFRHEMAHFGILNAYRG